MGGSEVERAVAGNTQVEDDQLPLSMHIPPLNQSRPPPFIVLVTIFAHLFPGHSSFSSVLSSLQSSITLS